MEPQSVVIWLVIGLIAGWLAGKIVHGSGFGIVGDIVVGIIGAVIAGWLLPRIGVTGIVGQPFINAVIFSSIGAITLLVLLRLLKR
ncbi:MAG: GlsB/YeaQ/YmgE family stress response membrane protein [Xanthobacteraceae bacterium]